MRLVLYSIRRWRIASVVIPQALFAHWFVLFSLIFISPSLFGQSFDVEDLVSFYKKRPLKFGGTLSAQSSYFLSSLRGQKETFVYQLNGNVNIAIFESLTLPLQFSLNNYGSNFSYPTLPNRLSLHPSYRWIRAHIGDVSMSLSSYTMNAYPFLGAGFEFTPSQWQISCLGGRFAKEVKYNSKRPDLTPAFERWGVGLKTHYTGQIFSLGGVIFAASDQLRKLSSVEDSLKLTPKKNIVFSVNAALQLGRLKISTEYALSLLTRDRRSPQATSNTWNKLFDIRATTAHYSALKAELFYTLANNTFGIGYEHVDPEYTTLGAYYFNNDFENFTASYGRDFFSGKLKFALRGGLQYDDLNGLKLETNLRYVGSVDLQYEPTEMLDFKLGYSSFQSHRNLKPYTNMGFVQTPYEAADTLNFIQRNHNIDFSFHWFLQKNAVSTQSINFSTRVEALANQQETRKRANNNSHLIDLRLDYVFAFQPRDFNLSLGTNFGNNTSSLERRIALGGHLGLQQRFLKKRFVCQLTANLSRTLSGENSNPYLIGIHGNASYQLHKQHRIQAQIAYQYTTSTLTTEQKWSARSQLSYQFTF